MSSVAAWVIVVWVPIPVLRLIGTLPLVLWLPGAALLRLSGRRRLPMSAVDVAITTALSAAVTIFAGLGISLATHQVARIPVATILAGLAIVAGLTAARMAPSDRRTVVSLVAGWTAVAGVLNRDHGSDLLHPDCISRLSELPPV